SSAASRASAIASPATAPARATGAGVAKGSAGSDRLVGGSDAVLVIDDTGIPKKGSHSVGVAPQYASMLGKRANCQTLVSVTLARDEVPVALGLRLFLPESWTSDVERMVTAGVPEPFQAPRSKLEIALQEIDRVTAQGVRFGLVLADAGYGLSASFRQGLSGRGLTWAVGIPKHQKVYPADVALVFPVAGRGRPRKNQIPDQLSVSAETCWLQPDGARSPGGAAPRDR
ncbi:DDE superfamily endonuclease, partial [Chelatococcus asaccharovorans]